MPEGTKLTFLQGPGPDGQDIRISLEIGRSLTPDELAHVLDGARRASTKPSNKLRLFNVRDMGDTKVLEEQKVVSDSANSQEQSIDWKITYFVHRDINIVPYSLDVLGMTAGQFDQSKDLLRKIIDSIVYEPVPRP